MGNYLMSTCDDGHEQVAYTSRNCPVCELLESVNILKKQIDDHICGE